MNRPHASARAHSARWLALALAGVSLLLLAHHLLDLAQVLHQGVAKAKLTLDFRTYLCGAADLQAPYDICHDKEHVSGFVYPPPSLLYFHLLSRLPIDAAFGINLAVCLAGLALASRLVLRMVSAPGMVGVATLLGALAIAPVGTSLAAGQVNILLMTSAVAGVWLAATERPARAGVAIALGFWLKIYPGLVPVLFLTRRKWPAAVATMGATLLIALVALIWVRPGLYLQYFLQVLPHAQGYTMPGVAQSLVGMVTHAQAGGGKPMQHFVEIPGGVQMLSRIMLAAGLLVAAAHGVMTQGRRPLDSLNLLLCASLFAAPNAWGYHYAMIFPAVLAALARALAAPHALRTPLVLACWLALVIPAWSSLPHALGAVPLLNVAFHGRYGLAALVLAGLILADRGKAPKRAAQSRGR